MTLLSEKYPKPYERLFIPNYHFYRIDRIPGLMGGNAVIVGKGNSHIHVDLLSSASMEDTRLCIQIGNSEILLAVVCKSPHHTCSDADVTELPTFVNIFRG
jgi:hypothetical protein